MTPKLVVFDLDFTLWDCGGTWCDCLSPPFAIRAKRVVDRHDNHVRLYPDVISILERCDDLGISMALASRTEQPIWARELLDLLGIANRFEYSEIYPSSKLRHFAALRAASKFDYDEMTFFDDEMRNISECSSLGVDCIYVESGIHKELFENAINRPT